MDVKWQVECVKDINGYDYVWAVTPAGDTAPALTFKSDTLKSYLVESSQAHIDLGWARLDADSPFVALESLPVTAKALAYEARSKRSVLLAQSDWTQMPDVQAVQDDSEKQAWANYRKALRDVPEQSGFPHNITWPHKPQ